MMATSAAVPVLAERLDIHKSCKTLETVVNILNDYCEAANAIVALQKKLAKALRESASMKCTADIPANALNTSATILEALSEVDSKFAKFADKECDGISTEVKKWFKKLSKAEKEHDARLATANGKIKAAVQAYERKAKKNPRDFAEEHTRYMNLLSTLGPEVNQDKYDHALFVTQRHSSTVYNLAACLSRVADAEWMRSFESVRKFSPTIGQLGEWRALCEGGWSGDIPGDLPDYNTGKTTTEPRPVNEHDSGEITGSPRPRELMPPTNEKPAPEYSSRDASEQENASRAVTPSGQSPVPPPQYFPEPGDKPEQHLERKSHSATSLASLASFPAPPTHFPIPPVSGAKLASPASIGPAKETETASESRTSSGMTPFPRLTESPVQESGTETPALTDDWRSPVTPHAELATPITSPRLTAAKPSVETSLSNDKLVLKIAPTEESRVFTGSRSNVQSASSPVSPSRKAAYVDDGEFGVRRSMDGGQQPKLRGAEPSLTAVVERSDTGKSQGSVVAALRDRYARPTVPSSPPPRGLPRLPTSVSSLANRYEPVTPTSPRHGTGSPAQERTRSSLDSFARMPEPPVPDRGAPTGRPGTQYVPNISQSTDEVSLRRQRIEALEELELREREHDLRMKEREIEQRARELDRERLHLLNARGGRPDGYTSDSSRGTATRISTSQRPVEVLQHHSYSHSTTQLIPPSSSSSSSRHPSSQPTSPINPPADHAPYCGCDACSVSKYKARNAQHSPGDSRPLEPPITLRPEKPKGWIRRLSMPVMGNAFSLDSKKINVGIAGGPGPRNSLFLAEEDGRLHTDPSGGIRNRSSTNLSRR